jgi:hypothetical protein
MKKDRHNLYKKILLNKRDKIKEKFDRYKPNQEKVKKRKTNKE